jgi:Ca2+-binding RTX toxin-like protein
MITAKGLKQTSQSQRSQPTREDYAEPEQEKKRIVPLAFLLFLTGCAAYLRSFLPIKLEAHEQQMSSSHDDAEQSDPRVDDEIGVATEEEVATASARETKSSDNVVPIRLVQESGDLLTSGSRPLEPAPPFSPRVATGPIGDAVQRGNDNRPPAPTNSGGGSGSGGGGGSGSGSGSGGGSAGGHDRQPPPRNPVSTPADTVHNRAPRTSGPVHLQDLAGCQVLMISILTLLAGTTDPDGDRLSIMGLSSTSGTLTQTEDGGWTFVRDTGMLGDVTLTYTISDGSASVQQTAYFRVVEAPPIIGTAGDDNLLGTHCADTIDGRAGDDNIDAREGNDIIIGGAGDDHIIAGPGNDIVYAGAGNDVVFAGAGSDIVFGGSGNDHLYGEDGDDTIMGEEGDDFISGGPGGDLLLGNIGNDTIRGDIGDDTIDGGDDDDNLAGDEGDDVISGGDDNDVMSGGDDDDVMSDGPGGDKVDGDAGDDHFVAAADAADDTYNGGTGRDTLDYSTATFSITVDVGRGRADGLDIGHDLIASFEEIIAGSGDDRLIGGSTSVSMTGGDGNDTFEFQRADEDDQTMTVRKITDFTVGDRIIAATFEIRYLQEDSAEGAISDMFDDIYLTADGDNRPVRFRFEELDNGKFTLVDVHDRPDTDDFYTIELAGHHHLQFTIAVT